MKSITNFLNYINIGFWTTLTNADFEVVKNNPHTLRGLQSTGLLLVGLACTLFGLQYLALSTFTGDQKFSATAASISVLVLIILDRTVLDSDSRDEGRIEHLLDTQEDSSEVADLKKKRASKMLVRVAIGITIAFIAATLSMPNFLKPEISAHLAAKEAELNKESIGEMNAERSRMMDMIYEIDNEIAAARQGLAESQSRESQNRAALNDDITELQSQRQALQSDKAFAENCREAENSGRIEPGCRNTGEPGRGKIYWFWDKKAGTTVTQIDNLNDLISEKRAEINTSAERITQTQIRERIEDLRTRKADVRQDMESLTKGVIGAKKQTGEWVVLKEEGVLKTGDTMEAVLNNATKTAHFNLFLFKLWVMVLELAIFAAKLCGSTKEYSLALYRATRLRRQSSTSQGATQYYPIAV